ncbi:MAG: DNA-binding protein HU-beta [Oleiphilaceae bacterium]|jgi:DNA-binding protein HU-beta
MRRKTQEDYKQSTRILKMNKSELVKAVAEKTGLTAVDTSKTLESFMDIVTERLAEQEDVTLLGFGTFKAKHRAEKQGRNPSTGVSITIAAKNVVQFKAGKGLTDKLNT